MTEGLVKAAREPLWTTAAGVAAALVLMLCACAGRADAATDPGTGVINEPVPCASVCDPPPQEPEVPDSTHSILVISVGWDGPAATASPLVPGRLGLYLSYLRGNVNDWFRQAAPGILPGWEFVGSGEYTIPTPDLPGPACSGDDVRDYFIDAGEKAKEAARKHGFNPDGYEKVVVQWDRAFCGFAGYWYSAGKTMVLNLRSATPMHEFGHSLGLDHAQLEACTDGFGNPVPFSFNCKAVEYGDSYDVMGRGHHSFGAIEAYGLGWLNRQFTSLTSGIYSRTITLKPLAAVPHGLRAIRLTDGANTFWIEYRQPVGLDALNLDELILRDTPGLLIHRERSRGDKAPASQLLDMSPSLPALDSGTDAGLPVGQTWANPLGTMEIRLDSADSSGATVTISSQLVVVPDVIGSDRKSALATINAAGLHFAGSTPKTTSNCDEVGKVIGSTPSRGSTPRRGADVTVTIGEKERGTICQ